MQYHWAVSYNGNTVEMCGGSDETHDGPWMNVLVCQLVRDYGTMEVLGKGGIHMSAARTEQAPHSRNVQVNWKDTLALRLPGVAKYSNDLNLREDDGAGEKPWEVLEVARNNVNRQQNASREALPAYELENV